MKSLIFLLFPILINAQNFYKDTLFLTDGRSYPSLITSIDDSKIGMIYSNNINESIVLPAIKRISLEDHGTVYLSDNGFITGINQIQDFIEKRKMKIEQAQLIKEEQERLAVLSNTELHNDLQMIPKQINKMENNRWSFGVLYVPYYSGRIYTIIQSSSYPPYQPDIYSYANNETNMEAQLSFAVLQELSFTFDFSYASAFYERRSEYHARNSGQNYEYDSGTFTKEDLTLFNFNLGIKYYIKNINIDKVSIYALAGIGKQLAFADEEYKSLFQQPPVPLSEDNLNEFTEDSNSPYHFNLGFGAEYFFNESLSITSNIRFIYSKIEAKYHSRTITEFETYTTSIDYKKSDFITRIGLGLNFYF